MEVELLAGYKKGDTNNIPKMTGEMVCSFIKDRIQSSNGVSLAKNEQSNEYRIDFVQVKKAELTEVRGIAFTSAEELASGKRFNVSAKIDECNRLIKEFVCDRCLDTNKTDVCPHSLAFLFWIHRRTTDPDLHTVHTFWGSEYSSANETPLVLRIHDLFATDELRIEAEQEADDVNEEEGQLFLNNILDEMEKVGLTDSALYKHCRQVIDEFEPIYIHHTMLDNGNNYIKDFKSFLVHMEEVAKQGLFDKLSQISTYSYKSQLWAEAQFCRIRCSLIYQVSTRKDAKVDADLLDAIFCKDREQSVEDRRQLKQHKRFILKQTEKLENKTYHECGLLLNESYPYICAAPDGITDDHIVEIKVPKSEEEFEKYLEGKETIAPKYMAQVQTQMYMANVTKALYCVLSPTFDTNGALHYVWVQADMEFVASLLSAAEDYFKSVVFPKLLQIYVDCN